MDKILDYHKEIADQLFNDGILERYNRKNILELYKRHNVSTNIDWDVFLKINEFKFTQGYFSGTEFFVKLIDENLNIPFSSEKIKTHKTDILIAEIEPDENAMFTPGYYKVKSSSPFIVDRIDFYRARFSGILEPVTVKIKGKLEEVNNQYYRFIIGEIINFYE